ncbi:MAG: cobalt-precorrin-5B (C(1))-methyltransferase [Thermodesulfobacteriota bacterium]
MARHGKRPLRKGITTGTCAAAGAKAAARALLAASGGRGEAKAGPPRYVDVTLPRGGRIRVKVKGVVVKGESATATVIKYAGDDPDVTNGADIVTTVLLSGFNEMRTGVAIRGGPGVGVVTRPGLKTPVGSPAINPVPRAMIRRSVVEAARSAGVTPSVVVTVAVPRGEDLARKTMNARLGIVGGISILGTTGIVEPMSLSAYTHSISAAVDVARASGLAEVVFSTGRSSEKVVEGSAGLPEVAFILTGDHMGYALDDAAGKGLGKVTIAGQFGKFTKLAAGHFSTHCTDSSVELAFIAGLAEEAGGGPSLAAAIRAANTARGAFFIIRDSGLDALFGRVAEMVGSNARKRVGGRLAIRAVLVGYDGEVVAAA